MRRNRNISGKTAAGGVYSLDVKLVPTLALFTLLVLAVFLGYHIDNTPVKATADAPTLTKTVAEKTTVETPAPDPLPTLVADMNAPIAAQPGLSASATLIDLNTGKEYDAGNYTQTYEAASTSKLVAIFDYIHLVEQGKATLTQMIDGQQAQDIIMRMIVYSDNDAWDTLNGYLTFGGEQTYLDSIGVAGKMTPEDIQFSTPAMAKLLRLLYQGKLMNPTNQAMIYNYMSHTTMNSLISAALPADAVVYHKYGAIDGVLHDASIVEYQGHKFVLVVYTSNPAGTSGMSGLQTNLIRAVTTAVLTDITKN